MSAILPGGDLHGIWIMIVIKPLWVAVQCVKGQMRSKPL